MQPSTEGWLPAAVILPSMPGLPMSSCHCAHRPWPVSTINARAADLERSCSSHLVGSNHRCQGCRSGAVVCLSRLADSNHQCQGCRSERSCAYRAWPVPTINARAVDLERLCAYRTWPVPTINARAAHLARLCAHRARPVSTININVSRAILLVTGNRPAPFSSSAFEQSVTSTTSINTMSYGR